MYVMLLMRGYRSNPGSLRTHEFPQKFYQVIVKELLPGTA